MTPNPESDASNANADQVSAIHNDGQGEGAKGRGTGMRATSVNSQKSSVIDDALPEFVAGDDGNSTSLRRDLGERHCNMIAFSSVIGIGLFLQNGRIINVAGPGMAWVTYLLMGSIMWSVQVGLGEMTALFPVPGAIFQMPCRFLDLSIGYAVAWMSWFAWVVVIAAELDAIANLFKFEFEPNDLERMGYPDSTLKTSTSSTNPAVWVTLFLILVLVINLLRVRWYGEIEYWFGVSKMIFMVGLIMFNIVINAQAGTGFRFYRDPWGFVSRSFTTPSNNVITGGSAQLAGVWTAMTLSIFSMIGFEAVSVTAAENKTFRTFEGVKISTRKIALRVIGLYTLTTFVVGLNVPYDDELLTASTHSNVHGGTRSAFVLAAVRAHKRFWPSFFNGFFILSATSAGLNSLYLASRILHAVALCREAWPSWSLVEKCRKRLTETGSKGVPRNAVFICWLIGFLGYLAAGKSPEIGLGRLAINSTASMLIVYAVLCITFLRFKRVVDAAAEGGYMLQAGSNNAAYSRSKINKTYPYRSRGQPLRTYWAFLGCITMSLFNGWRSISPFSAGDFIASYISIVVFLILWLTYRCALHWGAVFRFELHPTLDLSAPVTIDVNDPQYGRDKLHFEANERWNSRISKTVKWIWVWMK